MTTYVPLGVHTEYSLLHGMCRVDALVERARALRFSALGIADLHSAYGFVHFERVARAAGLRPVLGATVRLKAPRDLAANHDLGDPDPRPADDSDAHLLLFARDAGGYRNLLRLLSLAALENHGRKAAEPQAVACLDVQDLERFSAGLLALDGGLEGLVARALARGQVREAEQLAGRLREIFGPENFYMEVRRHGAPEESHVEPFVLRLARTLNIPLVATSDVRYLEPADAEAYEVLRCIGTGRTLSDPARPRFALGRHALQSDIEMRQLFRDLPEALDNTCVVAERCDVDLSLGQPRAPEYLPDSGREPLEELRRECERGAGRRYGRTRYRDLPVAVRDRLAHELAVVQEKKLASLFLIVQDVVRHAKEEGIPVGPGRGAAAGSLIAFALGITEIDPLVHDLLFERFLPSRVALPEFEIDVAHRRRDELVTYTQRRFGADRVAHLGTLDTLSARAAVREVGRVLEIPPPELDEVARLLKSEEGAGLVHGLESSQRLRQAYQDDARVRRLLDVSRRLEGLPHHPTLHAGGLVVTPGPLTDHVALQRTPAGETLAQATPEDVESLGLAKINVAGLRFLSVLDDAADRIESGKGKIDLRVIPLDDERTFRMLGRGDTACVFQLESAGMQDLLRDIQPSRFQDLVAALSLHRPGPLAAGLAQRYRARHAGLEPVTYPHPELEPILRDTHGILLHQEQLLRAAATVAGYDLDRADDFRHTLAHRQIGALARERSGFLSGAVERGVELSAAETVFDQLMHFTNFGFDRAHATAYALLAYRSAYVRAHYPLEYAAACLDASLGQGQRIREIVADASAHGVAFLDVDVNRSQAGYVLEDDSLRIGLSQVRALREAGVEAILRERETGGDFRNLYDFCCRLGGLPRRSIEGLMKAGAMGCFGLSRGQALAMLEETFHAARASGGAAATTPQLSFDFASARQTGEIVPVPEVPELPEEKLAEMEREALDLGVRHDPVLRHAQFWAGSSLQSSAVLDLLPDRTVVHVAGVLRELSEIRTRQGERMAFLRLEDLHGMLRVTVFPDLFDSAYSGLRRAESDAGLLVSVCGRIDRGREGTRVVAESLNLASAPRRSAATVTLFPGLDVSPEERVAGPRGRTLQPHAERRAGGAGGSVAFLGATARRGPRTAETRKGTRHAG